MGLYTHLQDVSSDSIPLLLVATVASCVSYLRSLLFGFLQSIGFSILDVDEVIGDGFLGVAGGKGSGLGGLIVLSEQLNVNRVFSYRRDEDEDGGGVESSDCVVCLCQFMDGEQVRKLDCCHVFHKECLDGWFNHLNLDCPLCRSPLVSDERVAVTERRVAADLQTWFSIQ